MRNTCTNPAFFDPRSAVAVNGRPALNEQVAGRIRILPAEIFGPLDGD